MFSLKTLLCCISIVSAIAFAAFAGTASAVPSGYSFTAVPQVSFVSPGQNALITYHGVNNTPGSSSCTLVVNSDSLSNYSAWSGVLAPGQDFGGSIDTGALYKNSKISFGLYCNNGVLVASRDVNVKVR